MKKIYSICILLTLLSGQIFAQSQYQWQNAGPDNVGSKTRAILVDGNRVIAGSTGGGLWFSDDSGVSWDRMNSYASQKCSPVVTTIAKDKNANILYVGTGEVALINGARQDVTTYSYTNDSTGFFGYIGRPGGGVYTSTDGGTTWNDNNATTQGATKDYAGPFSGINKILVHSSGRVYIGTRQGLYYSDNNLASVDTIWSDLDTTILKRTYTPGGNPQPRWPRFGGATIFDLEEGKDGVVYATAYAYTTANGAGGRISWMFRSTANVEKNSAGMPQFLAADSIKVGGVLTKIGRGGKRAELAVSASDNSYLYIAGLSSGGELSGIWRSTDKGQNWEIAAPQGNPGFTPLALSDKNYQSFVLEVLPDNPRNLIVAGNSWYTYTDATGWTQTGQASSPNSFNFIPSTAYCIAFDPNTVDDYYVGTDKQIVKHQTVSPATGVSFKGFVQRTKGYEGALCVSAASMNIITDDQTDPANPVQDTLDALMTGTSNNGILYNKFYNVPNYFAQQGFGKVNTNNWSNVEISSLNPGTVITQRSDLGLELSTNYGQSYASFYGVFKAPNVYGLTKKDSLVDRDKLNPGTNDPKGSLRDKGAANGYSMPNTTQFVLDEYIPDNYIDGDSGKVALQKLKSRIFFCSYKYLWVVTEPFKDSVKWNRITNDLVSGLNTITAIAVSGDNTHTVMVGTSNGELYRIDRPDDLLNYEVKPRPGLLDSNVVRISAVATGLPKGRWITSISIDPNDTKRVIVTYAAYGKWNTLDKSKLVCMTNDITAAAPVFQGISSSLPAAPVFCSKIVNNPNANNTSVLMVGTEKGLYSSTDWASFTPENESEIGNVPVTDIYVRKYTAHISDVLKKEFTLSKDNTIFVSTMGRGVFYTTALKYPRVGNPGEEPTVVTQDNMKLYPNPTANILHLSLDLVESADVQVSLVAVDGKTITTLEPVSLANGTHTIDFNTQSLTSGVYFLHVTTRNGENTSNKMLKFVVGR